MRTRIIVNIALSAAMLSVIKFVLSFLPNIELVTLLIIVYASCLRLSNTLAITSIFCAVEMIFFGAGTWMISYVIYWNALGLVMYFITHIKISNKIIKVGVITFVALVMTTGFGVLSTLVDTGLFTGFYDDFWTRFSIMYLRGGYFYLAQIVCNAIVIPLLYIPARTAYKAAAHRFLSGGGGFKDIDE